MLSNKQILTVAIYEAKTLRRSWFFRIFLGLTIFIFFFLNLGLYTYSGDGVWFLRALSGSIPYLNLLYLNIGQAVVAVFLSSDLLKRDNKMDTTEVIYTMPVSNSEYILGKVLGNVFVFSLVDFLLLLLAFIYNLIAPQMGVQPLAYLYYFLLVPIPTLLFITGLSFILMTLLRNQAVTFLLLLGFLGVSLFYLKGEHYYLFDQFSLYLPMINSEITGFDNPVVSVGQRLVYVFLGLSLILLTIGVFKRLPRSGNKNIAPFIFSAIFLILAVATAFYYINHLKNDIIYRQNLISLNNQYAEIPALKPSSYKINVKHNGNSIEGNCTMMLFNQNTDNVKSTLLRLNPGLKVNELKINGNPVKFLRAEHLIYLENKLNLDPSDSVKISIKYQGTIDERAMFLDVEEKIRKQSDLDFFKGGIRTAYLTKSYVLLTPESEWYPQTGVSFSNTSTKWYKKWFSNFSLEVIVNDSLFAISQGELIRTKNTYHYESNHKLPALTLVIGNFVEKSFKSDSLTFSVLLQPGHCYFENSFEKLKRDTLETIFRARFADYSRKVMLNYPFKRLSIVEVPIHYKAFQRPWSGSLENTQPEILLIPEKGALIENADFKRSINRIKRWGQYSGEGKLTDEEIEVRAIDRFIESFTKITIDANNDGEEGQIETLNNPYNLFPLFYDSRFFLESGNYPIIDRCLQSYFKNLGHSQNSDRYEDTRLSDNEKANKKLIEKSFADILTSNQDNALTDRVVNLKGEALFSLIQSKVGDLAFKNFLSELINNNSYKSYDFRLFESGLSERYNVFINTYINDWFYGKKIPGYQISNINAEKVKDGDRLKTLVKFQVKNTESAEGILLVTYILSDKNQDNRTNIEPETFSKVILLEPNQAKEVLTLLNKEPRSVTFNTLVSRNIPSKISVSLTGIKESQNGKVKEGEFVITSKIIDKEIIVDNEDSLFSIIQPATSGIIPVFLDNFRDSKEDEYSWFRWWRAPISWKKTIGSSYYGKNILSVNYCRAGEGERKAIWKVDIKETGLYEVYYHVFIPDEDYIKNNIVGEYHFSIVHDDGTDTPILDIKNAETGWSHLGTYYFSANTFPVVELTNKTTAKMVIADAVKFVKIN